MEAHIGKKRLDDIIEAFLYSSRLVAKDIKPLEALLCSLSRKKGNIDFDLAQANLPYVICLFDLDCNADRVHGTMVAWFKEKVYYSAYLKDMCKSDSGFALNVLKILPFLFKKNEADTRSLHAYTKHMNVDFVLETYFSYFEKFAKENKELALKFLRKSDELDVESMGRYAILINNLFAKDQALASKLVDLPVKITSSLEWASDGLNADKTIDFFINLAHSIYQRNPSWGGIIEGHHVFSLSKNHEFMAYSDQLVGIEDVGLFKLLLSKIYLLTEKLGIDSTRSYINAAKEVAKMDKWLGMEFAKQVGSLLESFDVKHVNSYIEQLLDVAQKNTGIAVEASKILACFMPKEGDMGFISEKINSLSSLDDLIIAKFMDNSISLFRKYHKGVVEIYADVILAANKNSWRAAYLAAERFPLFIMQYDANGAMLLDSRREKNDTELFLESFLKTSVTTDFVKRELEDRYKQIFEFLSKVDADLKTSLRRVLMNTLTEELYKRITNYEDLLKHIGRINIGSMLDFKDAIIKINKFYGNKVMSDIPKKIRYNDDLEQATQNLISNYKLDDLERILGILSRLRVKRGLVQFNNMSEEPTKVIYKLGTSEKTAAFEFMFVALLGYLLEKGTFDGGDMAINAVDSILEGGFQISAYDAKDISVKFRNDMRSLELEINGVMEKEMCKFYNALTRPHDVMEYMAASLDALRQSIAADELKLFSNKYFGSVSYKKICLNLRKREISSIALSARAPDKKLTASMIKPINHDGYFRLINGSSDDAVNNEEKITCCFDDPYINIGRVKSLDTVILGGFMNEYDVAFNLYNKIKRKEVLDYVVNNIDFEVMNTVFSFMDNKGQLRKYSRTFDKNKKEQAKLLINFLRER